MMKLLPSAVENKSDQNQIYRYERKYLISIDKDAQLRNLIARHPKFFSKAYETQVINNIYFDNRRLQNYYQNLNGIGYRSKHRLRWYSSDYLQGNTSSRQKSTIITTSPHFEIKKRSGDLISKHLLPTLAVFNGLKSNIPVSIHPLFKMAPDSFTKNFTYESEQKQELYLQKIKQYQPVIFNAYTRHYFLSANKKVRITIDTDVRFYEIYHKIINWRRYYQLQALVLEIKSSLSDANEIIDTAKYFPYSLSKCSKYVLGVMCCFPKIEAPLYQVLAQPRFDNHIV